MSVFSKAMDAFFSFFGSQSSSRNRWCYDSLKNLGQISPAVQIHLKQMEERMTICNMVVEARGKNGVVPPDSTTYKYLEDTTSLAYEPVYRIRPHTVEFFFGQNVGFYIDWCSSFADH